MEKKVKMSFEEKRRAVSQAAATGGGGGVPKTVNVTNQKVTSFLRKLREFQNKSRDASILVK